MDENIELENENLDAGAGDDRSGRRKTRKLCRSPEDVSKGFAIISRICTCKKCHISPFVGKNEGLISSCRV